MNRNLKGNTMNTAIPNLIEAREQMGNFVEVIDAVTSKLATSAARAEGRQLVKIVQANLIENAKASATYPNGATVRYDTATELYDNMVSEFGLFFPNIQV